VALCVNCGRESEGDFAFCPNCGAALAAQAPSREQRKTVTVLFCDVTGSTALGESVDPEALRALLARYFERMKEIVERHGGTVEKFIGDAVMAVFGVPVVHEDDALRAVRAAIEMREALPQLGVQARIGVNTGEVVTGTEERLATGDAVNVAARLEEAAQANEILVGHETLQLVREAVEVESLDPLELKGKSEPITAFGLLAVHEPPERRHEALFVGRTRELETVQEAWQRAVDRRRCELMTLVGDPGVGKSRLANEFLSRLDATVVRGRCLSYGEGITYWPVVEVVKQLDELPSDQAAAASLSSLLGETEAATSAEEIAWAFRTLLEGQAKKKPLVCLFDDIHSAEETFLDLIEHVALLSTRAPILLLCMARADLLDRRPEWPVALRLEPLAEADIDVLMAETIEGELRDRIARAAGGNPLFVTEMMAMARETGGDVVVPPTLQALLAARIDQLEDPERHVLERGAVEGEIFHRGSVQALAPDETRVTARLASLVRKKLIRPEKPQLPAEDAFRFRHLLIRDAAYDALPKATRAQLHERLAAWLDGHGGDLVELDEILGYHLEQAARYKAELGHSDPKLAERAGGYLAAAGRRALWRGDNRAAAQLLKRALELTRPHRFDIHLELDFAQAVFQRGDGPQAAAVALAAADRARVTGDAVALALARAATAFHRARVSPRPAVEELERLAREALSLIEHTGDHAGLVHVWMALGSGVANFRGRWGDWAQAAERALHHARLAGQRPTHLFALELALASGPRPADEALSALDKAVPDNPHPSALLTRAWLLAMLGRFGEASPTADAASERLRELSGDAWSGWMHGQVEKLKGDRRAAAQYFREACDLFEEQGQRFFLSSIAPMLARELCALGDYEEAERYAQLGRELDVRKNALGEALTYQVQALVLAHRGAHAQAEEMAHEAVAIIERTDGLNWQGDALCDLAEVLQAAGRTDQAAKTLEQALECYERKKNLAMIAQVRARLNELAPVSQELA
jgi:class 3 adenylate cyclase/tetratricopeptide (TPR) repeat protein